MRRVLLRDANLAIRQVSLCTTRQSVYNERNFSKVQVRTAVYSRSSATAQPSSPPSESPPGLRLFGITFRITLSFWIVSAFMGYIALRFRPFNDKNFWACLL